MNNFPRSTTCIQSLARTAGGKESTGVLPLDTGRQTRLDSQRISQRGGSATRFPLIES
jgi:hypothetical protein